MALSESDLCIGSGWGWGLGPIIYIRVNTLEPRVGGVEKLARSIPEALSFIASCFCPHWGNTAMCELARLLGPPMFEYVV